MVGPTTQSPIGALRQPQDFLECVAIPVRDPRTGEGYRLGRQAVIARAREHQQYGSWAHWRLMVGLVIVRPPNLYLVCTALLCCTQRPCPASNAFIRARLIGVAFARPQSTRTGMAPLQTDGWRKRDTRRTRANSPGPSFIPDGSQEYGFMRRSTRPTPSRPGLVRHRPRGPSTQ